MQDSASDYAATRQRHEADATGLLPLFNERLYWSRERLRELRQGKLRRLLEFARERSAWHRTRLAGIDVSRLSEAGLSAIPAMTKDELMANFDAIVTDPRLCLSRVEDHLSGLSSDAYLLGRYHAVASGGSSGRRGVYVYDWEGWSALFLSVLRQPLRLLRAGGAGTEPLSAAVLMGERATHVSNSVTQTFRELGGLVWRGWPVTAPLPEQLDWLQARQPALLGTYPSLLQQLTEARAAGQLRITPRVLFCTGEPLLASTRAAAERVWGCPLVNCWASSEAGGMGVGCGQSSGHHLSDDQLIIEAVDERGEPVPPGVRSSKLYVTNLFNLALPLIRFEITDEVTISDAPCPCGSTHRVASDVEGRQDDGFVYAGVGSIHPHLFRSRLGRERQIVEYQVRQVERGVEISLLLHEADRQRQGLLDLEQLQADLVIDLARAGLERAQVTLLPNAAFERTVAGKLKRFMPLRAPALLPALEA